MAMAIKVARGCHFLFMLLSIHTLTASTESRDNHLNVPQILLPYVPGNSVATNFTLKALKGCFHWTSTKTEIATVKPLYDNDLDCSPGTDQCTQRCSKSAVVTVTSSSTEKETSVIMAEEEASGSLLRCDVFVDAIHRIEIATTTRELLLGESPEVFDVYGYDEEGNLFSSLGSMEFNWYLSPVSGENKVDPDTVLRFLWFQGSSYETSPEIYALEEKRLHGSSVLMEGVNTGEAFVSAKLVHPSYNHVAPSTVKLMIVDNIILQPSSDVYILVETTVFYKVKQLRRGQAKEIKMPSKQYQLKLSHPECGLLDHSQSSVTGKALGTTKVLLVDNNMLHTKSVRQPSATVHVVEPGSIGFSITPGNVWVLEVGREYTITVEIYDLKKHRVFIADNTVLTSKLPREFLDVNFKSVNNSYHYVKALKSGKTQLNATLVGVQIGDKKEILKLKTPLLGEQQLEIYDPIKVDPPVVVFPWDPNIAAGKLYKIQFKATGGSGSYQWNSRNYTVATVTNKGLAISGNLIGSSRIKASDTKNALHYGEAVVMVMPPDEMHFLSTVVEAEIGKTLILPLSVSAYIELNGRRELKVFEDCNNLPMKILFSANDVFNTVDASEQKSKIQKNACKNILVKAVKPGFTTLTAIYKNGDLTLKASITIGAYPPLTVIDPIGIATVALGSSKIVALEGGPLPWILNSSGYYESLSPEEEEWVGIQTAEQDAHLVSSGKRNNRHFFEVTCKQITGEQLLTGQVGNNPTAKNQYPASSVASLRFVCAPPGSISLRPDIVLPTIDGQQKTLESCQDSNKRIPVRNNRELTILLVARDSNGQVFDNASSLDIKWSSSNTNLVKILHKHQHFQKSQTSSVSSASQLVLLTGKTGSVRIEAKISGYNKIVLFAAGIYDEDSKATIYPTITGSLDMVLVKERQIEPNHLLLFNHPLNKAQVEIKDGSGHYIIKSNEDSLADVSYNKKSEIMVIPRSPGRLLLSVYDLCLDSEDPASAEVVFADIHSIHVVVPDKVELHKTITAVVQMRDHNGNAISVKDMALMKLSPKFSSQIMEYKPEFSSSDQKSAYLDKAVYKLEGLAVGVTSLTYHAIQSNGNRIRSKPQDIQVFPPVRLDPRHILLIVGATFQVRSHGGPRPQSTTVFEIDNKTVSSVDHIGLITALTPGHAKLVGMAQGTDPHSNKMIVYSKDQITVEVIKLTGFKIHVPASTLIAGSEVGVYAVGYNGEGPFTFASSLPYLQFHWSSTNSEVASLKSVYDLTGVNIKNEKDFRIVLNTQKAGQATIKLRVEVADGIDSQILDNAILEDEIQIQVFDGLKVLFPRTGELLLPQNIETKIKTNRDGIARMSYEVIRSCADSDRPSVVEIASDGRVKTSSTSGSAAILVTSHEDFGLNQTVVVNIEVRAVASITLVSLTSISAGTDGWHLMPISSSATFIVTLHDNVGRRFDVSTIPLKHRLQRFDIVQVVPDVDNATYTVTAATVGDVILKVWDDHNTNLADYIRIRVGYGIKPAQASMSLGSMVCFKSVVKTTKESSSESWSSSDADVLKIDSNSGVAIGNGIGSAVVFLSFGDATTHVEVNIQRTSNVRLAPSGVKMITNAKSGPQQTTDIPILMDDAIFPGANTCDNTVIYESARGLRLPFSCSLSAADSIEGFSIETVLNVRSKYVNGKPYCEISAVDLPRRVIQEISTMGVLCSLQVVLTDHGKHNIVGSDAIKLPFVPAFSVSTNKLEISLDRPITFVKVTGIPTQLDDLNVKSDHSSLVQIQPVEESREHNSLEYQVKLLKDHGISSQNITITFRSATTGQSENIRLSLKAEEKHRIDNLLPKPKLCVPPKEKVSESGIPNVVKDYLGGTSSWFLLYSVLIATVILILLIYHNMTRRPVYPMAPWGQTATPTHYAYNYKDHGSPEQDIRTSYNRSWSPYQRGGSPYTTGQEKQKRSFYESPPSTAPGNRTLFSVEQ